MSQEYALGKKEMEKKKIAQVTQVTSSKQAMPLSTVAYGVASLLDNMEKMTSRYNGNSNGENTGNNGNGKENGGYRIGRDIVEAGVVAVTEIMKRYPTSTQTLVGFLPEEMRPFASEIVDMYKDEPWDRTIEFVTRMLRAKGKDDKTGEYRKTIDVAKDIAGEMLQEKFLEKIFGNRSYNGTTGTGVDMH